MQVEELRAPVKRRWLFILCTSLNIFRLFYYFVLLLVAVSDAITKHKESFPSKEDHDGAIAALLRLQDTYQLQPSAFVQGKLPGSVPSPKMHLSEVYDVGRHAYLNSDMFYTKSWMDETLKLYHAGHELEDVTLFDIYDHLSFSEYKVIFYYEVFFHSFHEYVVVQFYPWFKFYFPLF